MTDMKLEIWIGNLLRAGVSIAALIVAAGGVWRLALHASEILNYRVFVPYHPPPLPDPDAVIQIGLYVLIATPIFRVLFAVIGFWFEHDYLYVVVSAIVLAVLLFSIWHAL